MSKAIFLDRDGVINHDPGDYTKSIDEFTLLPGILETLKELQDSGFSLILITNQGGIAKGLYTHEHVAEIHTYFKQECLKHGVEITDIFYSPHHDDYGRSLTRKPGSLMIEKAIAKHQIDASRSVMVGDKQRDLDAASPAGVDGVLIPTNAPLADYIEQLKSR